MSTCARQSRDGSRGFFCTCALKLSSCMHKIDCGKSHCSQKWCLCQCMEETKHVIGWRSANREGRPVICGDNACHDARQQRLCPHLVGQPEDEDCGSGHPQGLDPGGGITLFQCSLKNLHQLLEHAHVSWMVEYVLELGSTFHLVKDAARKGQSWSVARSAAADEQSHVFCCLSITRPWQYRQREG